MIIIKLQGGLANQLFQWMFGYSLAKKNNEKIYYDISFFKIGQNDSRIGKRDFELNKLLNYKVPLLNKEVIDEFNSKPTNIVYDNSPEFTFIYNKDNSYYFDGYWQNENYFKDYRNEILSLINFETEKNFDFNESCSIHVRRGDYLNLQYKYTIQPVEYYEEAINIIKPKGNIYVFSDDISWCKDNFKFNNMIFMEGNSNIEDLKLMSFCENNMIANSSFSWMGAWLNKNENKKVIFPKKWFTDSQFGLNLGLKQWIKI